MGIDSKQYGYSSVLCYITVQIIFLFLAVLLVSIIEDEYEIITEPIIYIFGFFLSSIPLIIFSCAMLKTVTWLINNNHKLTLLYPISILISICNLFVTSAAFFAIDIFRLPGDIETFVMLILPSFVSALFGAAVMHLYIVKKISQKLLAQQARPADC